MCLKTGAYSYSAALADTTNNYICCYTKLLIQFLINGLLVWFIKSQKMVENVDQSSPRRCPQMSCFVHNLYTLSLAWVQY